MKPAIAVVALAGGVLVSRLAFGKAPSSTLSATLLARSADKMSRLHPKVAELAREHLIRAAAYGIPAVVHSGYRSNAEQAALYAQGRTTPGAIVTKAEPGESWHNYGLAYDLAILTHDGKPSWPDDNGVWDPLGAIGESLGLSWGKSFGDRPHFSYHPGLSSPAAAARMLRSTGTVSV